MHTENRATYCPEDNKLRLYVGRVPRAEYDALRAEGWTSTPKQSEAGQGEFAATWTPERRDRALSYAEFIEDEDAGPEERAADRAERFGQYRENRIADATGHADRFEAGPAVFGFQDRARAMRAADRLDRVAGRAVDAWDKAEYWQRRTAGVIAHALHKSTPSVRMGRIKELEADLRRMTEGSAWHTHTALRLAYENQMLEAAGGRAGAVEMEPAGWILANAYPTGSHWRQIRKVNKSKASGRVVSVEAEDAFPSHRNHYGNAYPEGVTRKLVHKIDVERLAPECYRAPTDEERAAFAARRKAEKAAAPKKSLPPIINPTDADAERLQSIMNESNKRWYREPAQVARMTQAEYSARATGGSSAACETVEIVAGGRKSHANHTNPDFPTIARIRVMLSRRVVILTDKPQEPISAEQWTDPKPAAMAKLAGMVDLLDMAASSNRTQAETEEVERLARCCGLFYRLSMCQFGYTEAGRAWRNAIVKASEVRA